MAIETHTLIEKLSNGRKAPYFGPLVSAAMQGAMVQYGTIPRFYMNNGRQPDNLPLDPFLAWFGGACFLGATASFAFTTLNVLEHIGPLDAYADPEIKAEMYVLVALAYVQIIYPVTSVVDFVWMWMLHKQPYAHNEFSSWLSTVKDLAYGTADVTSKAGLCLVAFLVATRT